MMNSKPLFKTRGFYLHASWMFNYPFAVRTWSPQDFSAMFRLLRHLEMDRVMLWPMTEMMPPPLSTEDKAYLGSVRETIAEAQRLGLECWITSSPNLTTRPEIRKDAFKERHFYPYLHTYHFDDPAQFQEFISHLEAILACLNNADGYVFIDGDPGSYPGAKPEHFLQLFHTVRDIIDRIGVAPRAQKVIPWIWCGWGSDWVGQGPWKPDLPPLVRPVLDLFKRNPPGEPWEMLPGRSNREGWANGRINFELAEEAGLIERSTLMTYEIIEYEPTPPAVALQFDDIRRVIRQEMRYASLDTASGSLPRQVCRGIFGNAQQPVLALPNLFYFARCTRDAAWLIYSDRQVLTALAEFLGGPAELLVPTWSCLQLGLDALPSDLPQRLRQASLTSEVAACIPGGPERYLQALADFVAARLAVLEAVDSPPVSDADAARRLGEAAAALAKWWQVHEYVLSGEGELGFAWEYTHPKLLQPLQEWVQLHIHKANEVLPQASASLAETGVVDVTRARELLTQLLE